MRSSTAFHLPLDLDLILESVAKTRHLVVVDPVDSGPSPPRSRHWWRDSFWSLDAPIKRVVSTHIPYNAAQERSLYPTAERVAAAVGVLG